MNNTPSAVAKAFGTEMAVWKENQQAPWGRLRYEIIRANLRPHLNEPPRRILDMGGGNGLESLWLAQEGYQVDLVDFSADMLAEAHSLTEEADVTEQITLHQADVLDLPRLFSDLRFDAALFHNVIQYVPDPNAALRAIGAVLRPGGLLSLCSLNPHSETYAAVLREFDVTTALEVVRTGERKKEHNIFGLNHPLYSVEKVTEMLQANGFEIVAHYGVRCVCDYIADNDIKSDPAFFEGLVQLEMALRDRYPYYLQARFYQLVARKQT